MAQPEPPSGRQNFLGGFKLTLEHLGRPPVTRQYPAVKRPKQPRQHGRHVLNRYEDGMEKCIGCALCAAGCPADCLPVRGAVPPEAVPESKLFEFSFTNRADAIYTKRELLVDDDGPPQRLPWEDWREG